MLSGVQRCDECGFTYDEAAAAQAARMIRDGAAGLAAILEAGHADQRAERSLRWLAIHTVHEVRHHLRDVRQQVADTAALTPAEREVRWRLGGP